MKEFYTDVFVHKGSVQHHYVDSEGNRQRRKEKFEPQLGITTRKNTGWKGIKGENLGLIDFQSIWEMNEWKKENRHAELYNDVQPEYQFISKTYPDQIDFDFKKIKIYILDIEVYSKAWDPEHRVKMKSGQALTVKKLKTLDDSEKVWDETNDAWVKPSKSCYITSGGFPEASKAEHPVTAISLYDYHSDKVIVFGSGDFEVPNDSVEYINSENEDGLIYKFLDFFHQNPPDILSGWNTEGFDIPYMVNRIKRLFSQNDVNKLSPYNTVREYTIDKNNDTKGYKLLGIQHLDYLNLYKKFSYKQMERYSLDFISRAELGDSKIDYHSEYDNLADLYEKNYQLYLEYNVKDTELVKKIDERKQFFQTVCTLAYMTKTRYEDTMGTVKIWDIQIYNELLKQKKLVPPSKNNDRSDFLGGYVQTPIPGKKKFLAVFDIASSYPNQIISYGMSPENVVSSDKMTDEMKKIRQASRPVESESGPLMANDIFLNEKFLEKVKPILKKENVTLACNGEFFKKGIGFLPQIYSDVYNMRKTKKKEAAIIHQELNSLKEELKKLKNK